MEEMLVVAAVVIAVAWFVHGNSEAKEQVAQTPPEQSQPVTPPPATPK
jgi:flagellar basal body-associated protein FliL